MDGSLPATPREIVRRLLDVRLIAPAHAVDGDVTVRNVSRSNGVFVLETGEHEYVLKGPGLAGPEGHGSLELEARFYARVAGDRALAATAPVPRLLSRVGDLLVLRRTRPGETLEERYRQRGGSSQDVVLLGRALGAWRRISTAFADLELPGRPPWVLGSLETPGPAVVAENPGASRLVEAVRSDATLREGLARLRGEWRSDAVIHGDVRWDNALVEQDPASGGERVVLVDWELLDAGDAGWDVAGALADGIALEALPADTPPTEATYRRASRADLARLSPALASTVRAFVEGYGLELPPDTVEDDLRAGIRFLPARLLNIAFLHAAWDPSFGLASAVSLAGIAAGLLERREEPVAP